MGLTKTYLLSYNLALAVAWLFVVVATLGEPNPNAVYDTVRPILLWAQTAAVLEIGHAFFGIVKSPVALTFFQVFSREWTLWVMLVLTPETRVANVDAIGAVVNAVVPSWAAANSASCVAVFTVSFRLWTKTMACLPFRKASHALLYAICAMSVCRLMEFFSVTPMNFCVNGIGRYD